LKVIKFIWVGGLPTDEKLTPADICGQLLTQPQQKLAV
jgi:hypothetical protein